MKPWCARPTSCSPCWFLPRLWRWPNAWQRSCEPPAASCCLPTVTPSPHEPSRPSSASLKRRELRSSMSASSVRRRERGEQRRACTPRDAAQRDSQSRGEYGLDVRVIGTQVGQASRLKMCYASLTKGLTAMATKALTASGADGVGRGDAGGTAPGADPGRGCGYSGLRFAEQELVRVAIRVVSLSSHTKASSAAWMVRGSSGVMPTDKKPRRGHLHSPMVQATGYAGDTIPDYV